MTETERVEMPERVYREEARLFHAKDGHVTNYDRLFGTPERAAETLFEMCGEDFGEWCPMDTCPMAGHDDKSAFVHCKLRNGAAAWLNEEAEDD